MLYLIRSINESIIIGNDIEIKVINVDGKKVSFGITAPRDITVNRKEVHEKTQSLIKHIKDGDGKP